MVEKLFLLKLQKMTVFQKAEEFALAAASKDKTFLDASKRK